MTDNLPSNFLLTQHQQCRGYIQHQIHSYNHLISTLLDEVVAEESTITVKINETTEYIVTFSRVQVGFPKTLEDNRELKTLTPNQARIRNITYASPISVDVTTKFRKNDQVTEITNHPSVKIGELPMMVGSCKCTLSKLAYMTKEEKIAVGECMYETGGFFIIKGQNGANEKVLIPQERPLYNHIGVYKQKPSSKHSYVGEVRSISPTTGHSVLVKAFIGKNEKNINFSLPYINAEIPVGIVFIGLGFSLGEISELVRSPHPEANKYISTIMSECTITDKNEALDYMSNYAIHVLDKDKNRQRSYVIQILENEVFPHMGVISQQLERGMFLGSIVRKLLETSSKVRDEDDRDNIAFKRFETAGMLVAGLFRSLFKRLVRSCTNVIDKRPDIIAAITRFSPSVTIGLSQCFSTGKWGVQKNSWTRQGVTQVLSRLTHGATLSHLRRIVIPVGKEGKNTQIRQLHGSQIFYICLYETPEGHSSGIVKNLSLLSTMTNGIPPAIVLTFLEKIKQVRNIVYIAELRESGKMRELMSLTKIFLNRVLAGVTKEPQKVCKILRKLRNRNIISREVSIAFDDFDDEINIFTDGGRLSRPLIPVKKNKVKDIDTSKTWDELVKDGSIIYLCPGELENYVVAMDEKTLVKAENIKKEYPGRYDNFVYNFIEISPAAMMGVCASVVPFPDHSQSPRNCYQSAMGKQALGIYSTTNNLRVDTEVHMLMYPQKPLITTKTASLLGFDDLPSGQNARVAILTCMGFNQEDSLIVNEGYIQRGGHRVVTYKTTTHVVKKNGTGLRMDIGLPPPETRKRMVWYGSLETNPESDMYGVIKVGSTVNGQKTVLIGRYASFTTKDGQNKTKDASILAKCPHQGTVDRVWICKSPDGLPLIHIKIRYVRIPEVGDKFASREAQKGTCGFIMKQEDMPFTDSGETPDIIINPHCIPSRMTVNQLIESLASLLAVKEGRRMDATPFTDNSTGIVPVIQEALKSYGLNPKGETTMTNGMTGERLRAKIFFGSVYYQRLKHMVSDKLHARARGELQTLTRQPLEGRSRDGGLRFGEMERDCMISQGTAYFLHERLLAMSDYFEVHVCQKCKQWCNPGYCTFCECDTVSKIMIPYAGKLLFNELRALLLRTNIVPQIDNV